MSFPEPLPAPRTPTNLTRPRNRGRVFSYLTILTATPALGMLAGYLLGGNY